MAVAVKVGKKKILILLDSALQIIFLQSKGILNNSVGISSLLVKVTKYSGKNNGLNLHCSFYPASYWLYEHRLFKLCVTVSFSASQEVGLDNF